VHTSMHEIACMLCACVRVYDGALCCSRTYLDVYTANGAVDDEDASEQDVENGILMLGVSQLQLRQEANRQP